MVSKKEKLDKEKIETLMRNNINFLELCVLKLYTLQTNEEQDLRTTIEKNTRGFSVPDSPILTDFGIWISNRLQINEEKHRELLFNKSKNEALSSPHMSETWKAGITYRFRGEKSRIF